MAMIPTLGMDQSWFSSCTAVAVLSSASVWRVVFGFLKVAESNHLKNRKYKMNDSQSLFVWVVASIFICFAHAHCPEQPKEALNNCLTDLGISSTSGRGLNVLKDKDGDKVKKLCRSNKMFQATNCMQKIIDDCENTNFVKQLEKLIDIKRWNETTKLLCNNIDYISQNKGCLMQNQASTEICIEKENKKFQAKLQDIMGENPDEEEVMDLTCRLKVKMWKCTSESLQDSCPEKLLRIVKDIDHGLSPPFCDDYYGSYAVVKSGSVFLVCLAAVVAKVSGFLNMI